MSTSNLKIGWIGAGRMGAQLVTACSMPHDVTVYNRTRQGSGAGRQGASSPPVPSTLPTATWCSPGVSANDLEVMLGDGGLLTGESSPVIADASTVSRRPAR